MKIFKIVFECMYILDISQQMRSYILVHSSTVNEMKTSDESSLSK